MIMIINYLIIHINSQIKDRCSLFHFRHLTEIKECQAVPHNVPTPHPCDSPSTQGRIIHSTVVGAGPCRSCSVVTMCWEARSSRKRKVR